MIFRKRNRGRSSKVRKNNERRWTYTTSNQPSDI